MTDSKNIAISENTVISNEAGRFFIVNGDYAIDRNSAYSMGLIAVKSIKKELLYAMIEKYNATFSTTQPTTEPTTQAIEVARKTFDLVYRSSPIVAIEPVQPEVSALEQVLALGSISPELADRLVKQFQQNQIAQKSRSTAKKDPIDNAIKIAETVEKHRIVYSELLDLINAGNVRTKAQMILALKYDSSAGRIGFMYTAYKLYQKSTTLENAVNLGQISMSKLASLGTRSNRSAALSDFLGYPVNVNLD